MNLLPISLNAVSSKDRYALSFVVAWYRVGRVSSPSLTAVIILLCLQGSVTLISSQNFNVISLTIRGNICLAGFYNGFSVVSSPTKSFCFIPIALTSSFQLRPSPGTLNILLVGLAAITFSYYKFHLRVFIKSFNCIPC